MSRSAKVQGSNAFEVRRAEAGNFICFKNFTELHDSASAKKLLLSFSKVNGSNGV